MKADQRVCVPVECLVKDRGFDFVTVVIKSTRGFSVALSNAFLKASTFHIIGAHFSNVMSTLPTNPHCEATPRHAPSISSCVTAHHKVAENVDFTQSGAQLKDVHVPAAASVSAGPPHLLCPSTRAQSRPIRRNWARLTGGMSELDWTALIAECAWWRLSRDLMGFSRQQSDLWKFFLIPYISRITPCAFYMHLCLIAVANLGIWFDNYLKFDTVIKSCFYHIHLLSNVKLFLYFK